MKHFGLAVLVVFAVLFVTGPIHFSAAAQSEAVKSMTTEAKPRQVNGKVVSLDPQSKQLIVKSKKAESSFVLTPETVFKRGRNPVQPSSLKTGATVRVRYYEQNGQLIADRVTITSSSAQRKGVK
jgi:hypothetical protein